MDSVAQAGSWSNILRGFQHESVRVGRRGHVYLLDTGEQITSREAEEDERNVHGLNMRQLGKRLQNGERDPGALWAPLVKRKKS